MDTKLPLAVKKQYKEPELTIFGNLAALTRNVGPKGAIDGGGGAAAGPKASV